MKLTDTLININHTNKGYVKYMAHHSETEVQFIIVKDLVTLNTYAIPLNDYNEALNNVTISDLSVPEDIIRKTTMNRNITNCSNRIFRHFKGDNYLVLDFAYDVKSSEFLVVYMALYENCKICVRPYDMFVEPVPSHKKNPTGQYYRFEVLDIPSVKI